MRKVYDFIFNSRLIGIVIIASIWLLTYCAGREVHQQPSPQIAIEDAKPCVYKSGEWVTVDKFHLNEKKYICFNMTSETTPVHLTFSIYKNDELLLHSYTRADEFMEGFNSFEIEALPGKYMVTVKYGRPSLADVYFIVSEQ